jgi:hypothetical protein
VWRDFSPGMSGDFFLFSGVPAPDSAGGTREIFSGGARVVTFWEHERLSPSRTLSRLLALGSCRCATAAPPCKPSPIAPVPKTPRSLSRRAEIGVGQN